MFVTFEGPEGAGKTTQITLLADSLVKVGHKVMITREPGGTPLGEQVRRILLNDTEPINWRAEVFLFCAARAQLLADKIVPALSAGQIVLCDRFADSTLAYQGYGRMVELSRLQVILPHATGGMGPNLTILLDLPVEVGLARRMKTDVNRLDMEPLAFHQRVRDGYLQMAREEPDRWVVVDAARPMQVIHREVLGTVLRRLGNS